MTSAWSGNRDGWSKGIQKNWFWRWNENKLIPDSFEEQGLLIAYSHVWNLSLKVRFATSREWLNQYLWLKACQKKTNLTEITSGNVTRHFLATLIFFDLIHPLNSISCFGDNNCSQGLIIILKQSLRRLWRFGVVVVRDWLHDCYNFSASVSRWIFKILLKRLQFECEIIHYK